MATTAVMRGDRIEIPAEMRERFGLTEGSVLLVESDAQGIHLRPDDDPMSEIYTPERIAEFMLNNVWDAADYAAARAEVAAMGLDPDIIRHLRPDGIVR